MLRRTSDNMSGSLSPAQDQEAPLPKTVQELAMNGNEPPTGYIRKVNSNDEETIVDAVSYPFPVVDLHRLSSSSSSPKDKEEEMEKLRSALSLLGLFQVRLKTHFNFSLKLPSILA
uniref:Uncharacterized protein n=1 Tax=Nelumbo nucifera TaxID=4432 RepID=A0A822ZT59_NELNU|nr:TPA_asm: hypothetical protein HUJ06_003278 [Nelumbo nucifera]